MSTALAHVFRRSVAALLALILVSAGAFQIFDTRSVPRAEAQFGGPVYVAGINPVDPVVISLVGSTAATAVATGGQFSIMNILNGIAWLVAKTAVQSITRSIVNWINSGFHGSPAFVTDLKANLLNVGDIVAGAFVSQLAGIALTDATGEYVPGDFLCSPFRLELAGMIQTQYLRSTSPNGYFLNNVCSLNGIVNNLEQFSGGDFAQGGWGGWLAMTTDPRNNIYGSYFSAKAELSARIVNAQGESVKLLDWGRGFLSWCGDTSAAAQTQRIGDTAAQNIRNDVLSNGIDTGPLVAPDGTIAKSNGSASLPKEASAAPKSNCKDSDGRSGVIKTPGSVIENQLELSLGSGIRQLELADSINEIVGALVQQLVTQALGATGLGGLSTPSYSGRSYVDRLGDSSQYAASIETARRDLDQIVSDKERSVQNYQSDWDTIGNVAASAKSALQNYASRCSSESSSVNAALATVVEPALADAATADQIVEASLTELAHLLAAIGSAATVDDINRVAVDVQGLNAVSIFPTTEELSYAAIQSKNSDDPSATLVGKMNDFINQTNTGGGGLFVCQPITL